MILRTTVLLLGYRVGIVKADQSFGVETVQRQRIIESVRPLHRHRHARHHEPDPVTTFGIEHEYLAIEI
jgi:hypothetical protein